MFASGSRHLVLMCVVEQRWEHYKDINELCFVKGSALSLCSKRLR